MLQTEKRNFIFYILDIFDRETHDTETVYIYLSDRETHGHRNCLHIFDMETHGHRNSLHKETHGYKKCLHFSDRNHKIKSFFVYIYCR